VERVVLPDATIALDYALDLMAFIVEGLVVYPAQLRANLDRSGGLWASEGVLLELVRSGLARQEAYVLVQRNAMRALGGHGAFRDLLVADPDIRSRLDEAALDRQFDLDHALAHVDAIIERTFAHGAPS